MRQKSRSAIRDLPIRESKLPTHIAHFFRGLCADGSVVASIRSCTGENVEEQGGIAHGSSQHPRGIHRRGIGNQSVATYLASSWCTTWQRKYRSVRHISQAGYRSESIVQRQFTTVPGHKWASILRCHTRPRAGEQIHRYLTRARQMPLLKQPLLPPPLSFLLRTTASSCFHHLLAAATRG